MAGSILPTFYQTKDSYNRKEREFYCYKWIKSGKKFLSNMVFCLKNGKGCAIIQSKEEADYFDQYGTVDDMTKTCRF